jgi:TonB family protein
VAAPDRNQDEAPSRVGYFAAIIISALGHLGLFALVFFVAPRYLHQPDAPPPAYTVKIVDNIPAGDLGTHLPRINRHRTEEAKAEKPKPEEPKVKVEPPKPPELAPNDDKNAFALNTKKLDTPTETPTPEPTVAPTPEPTPMPTETPKPTPKPKKHATPKPTPQASKRHPKAEPSIVIAKASVERALAALRKKNFEEHVKAVAKAAAEEKKNDEDMDDESDDESADTPDDSGGGPVAGKVASAGKGYGVGPGEGSEGILKDPEFLLYYKTVQDQIKKAWSFTGGSNDLTATVDFAIGPDGTLTGAKVGDSSKDSAFDDSVIRAIRRAAPFPPPPDKYRDQFSSGIKAVFQLGELKS